MAATLQTIFEDEEDLQVPAEYLAAILTVAGSSEDAFLRLEKALQERSEPMLYLGVDPIFDTLRQDLWFEVLTDRVARTE